MALDSALQYLDELKDKYMHEVEKAIEDWDYQDFSPDKRTPLLENEVTNDVADDREPESNALQQIKDAQTLDWAGLSRDEALADQDYASVMTTHASYEARVVAIATPAGGIQGIPDNDSIQRFLSRASHMNAALVADACSARLQQNAWQIRSKTLVLMELLLENPDMVSQYLQAFVHHPQLLKQLDVVRCNDHNLIARENARKVMSLIRSNGASTVTVAREHTAPKPHVRHVVGDKPKKLVTDQAKTKPKLTLHTQKEPTTQKKPQHHYQSTSPKIAAAALASWRRRSHKELLAAASPPKPNLLAFQKPPTSTNMHAHEGFRFQDEVKSSTPLPPVSPSIKASVSRSSRLESGSLSGFSFLQQQQGTVTRLAY